MQNRYFTEIDLTKGFAIILAVFGHAAPDAVKGFWIVGTDSISASLHYLVYSFHMALFFACSGFLLYPKLTLKDGVKYEIYKRFKKLMIPYFFLSFIYLGGKMLGGSLADNQLTDNPFIGILFGSSPCFGAWFLWCLFIMTMLVLCLRKINILVLFTLFLVVSFIPFDYGENYMGLQKVHSNTMFLLSGCLVRKYYYYIYDHINILIGIFAAIILFIIHGYGYAFEKSGFYMIHSISILKTFAGIIASFVICFVISSKCKDGLSYKTLKICGDYCMDIYIISMFILVPLRILYVNVGIMNYIPYYTWLIVATTLGVFLPVILSKYIIRKVGLLKLFLLGG